MSSIKSKASVGSADAHSLAFELSIREVNGQYRLATGDEVIQAARRAIARKFRRGTSLTTPTLTKDYLRLQLAPLEHEIFACVFGGWCIGAPARSGQGGSTSECGGRDLRALPSVGESGAESGG
jgi:hypothetical protein